MRNILALMLVVALSGFYTSLWGAFKDGPYEGFRWRTFPRSILFSLLLFAFLFNVPRTSVQLSRISLAQLFLLVMGAERIATEIYKACFRESDQSRLHIPQRLNILGRAVHSAARRWAVGIALAACCWGVLCIDVRVEGRLASVGVAFLTGMLIAAGGAFKDAPFEGFDGRKFFRSALVLVMVSPLTYALGPTSLGLLIYINGGLERLIVEYYKSYILRGVPGKFRADLPRIEGQFIRYRPLLSYAATVTLLLFGLLTSYALGIKAVRL